MSRATVVIVNWNGAHLLGPCLDAVAKQDIDDFETWVADNASSDDSVAMLRRDYPWVRVIETGANLGFAGGNNAALREVTTPYAVLLNNDAVPEPTWLSRTLAALDAHPEAGCVTPKIVFLPRFVPVTLSTDGFVPGPQDTRELGVRIYGVSGTEGKPLWERLTYGPEAGFTWTRPAGEFLLPVGDGPVGITWAAERDKDVTLSWDGGSVTLPVTTEPTEVTFTVDAPRVDVLNNAGGIVFADGYGADRAFQEVDTGQYDAADEVFNFCGNGVAFRREVLADVGLFDDDFFLYYEDTDLSWRLRAKGWAVRYEPSAVLRHHHSASSGEESKVFRFHVDRNRLLLLTKNASWRLAVSQVGRYPLTTASIALRAVRSGNARSAARPTLLRLRVMASYLRLLPSMLRKRRAIDSSRTVSRRDLERWLVPRA
ncbi:MAG TPA: glycosyltransferase family 2 protein [Frankiaceae bacterium]|nr:glycosyltransferase family 2 protein [Frankiaceae bacterium]